MGSVNRVILVGFLGRDPEIKALRSGEDRLASFSLATSKSWRTPSGEKREKTEWHRVVVFNQQVVGTIQQYVKKGSCVYVEGELQNRKWTDDHGIDRYMTEVVVGPFSQFKMLDRKSGDRAPGHEDMPEEYQRAGRSYGDGEPEAPAEPKPHRQMELDDDIPF